MSPRSSKPFSGRIEDGMKTDCEDSQSAWRPPWAVAVFSMELRRILTYRMDFWIQFVGSLLAQFGVAWFLWKAIYTHGDLNHVGPFSFSGMMLYYLAAPLVGKIIQSSEIGHMSEDIYSGTLNRYLLYPVSFFRYKLAAGMAQSAVFALQFMLVLAVVAAVAGVPEEFHLSAGGMLGAALAILLGGYLHFVMISAIELSAFWADNVWSLVVITRFLTGLLGGAMIPLALFPDWAVRSLHLLPFPYFVSFPVETLFGMQSPARWAAGMITMALWAVGGTLLYRALWRSGQLQYTGVGI